MQFGAHGNHQTTLHRLSAPFTVTSRTTDAVRLAAAGSIHDVRSKLSSESVTWCAHGTRAAQGWICRLIPAERWREAPVQP